MGLFESLWRFITFYKLRKAMGLARAADAQFTSSADGISDAYDLHHEQLIREYKEFISALSEIEMAMEQKRERLKKVKKDKDEAERALEGALAVYERAMENGSQKTMDDAEHDGENFRQEVNKLTEMETLLTTEITEQEKRVSELERRMSSMQKEVNDMPIQKGEAIADFVSNKKLIEANERLMGLRSRIDSGPIDAVRKANLDLAAKARVTDRLAGTDAKDKRDQYINAGDKSVARTDFKKLIDARKAEREATTGEATSKESEERPKI